MNLTLSMDTDANGIHLVDSVSRIGMHWKTVQDAERFLAETAGEDWEQSFRAALQEIYDKHPDLDKKLTNKNFTFTKAKASTTWD